MNKKLIVLILFVFLLISTVLISLLGKKPDPPIVRVDNISFEPNQNDNYSYNEENILVVVIDITNLNKTGDSYVINYQLNCKVKPDNAVNKIILYNVFDPANKEYVEFTSDGLLTITLNSKVSKDFVIIATSTDDAVRAQSKMIVRLHVDQSDNPW